jgi:hypothetical protein
MCFSVLLLLLQKDGGASYAAMEDVCFGAGDGISQKYFMSMIPEWFEDSYFFFLSPNGYVA